MSKQANIIAINNTSRFSVEDELAGNMHTFPTLKEKLKRKLDREHRSEARNLLVEDIRTFIESNDWNDKTIQGLLAQDSILFNILTEFLNDDDFISLFDKKIRALIEGKKLDI